MINNEIQMTREGFEKLQNEHDYLVGVKRKEVALDLKEAMGFGDLAENAEYEAARVAQAELEHKISQIKDKLSKVVIIDTDELDLSIVSVGVNVRVKDEFGEDVTYKIVGIGESDLDKNKISISSPVGNALLGAKKGENVKIKVPNGEVIYKVLEITA